MKLWVLNKLRFLCLFFQYINALAHKKHWALFGKLEDNPYQNIYLYIYVCVCMQSGKQCVLSVIITMALWSYHAPSFACWALFGALVQAMCNRTSCAQVHELPQSYCGDNQWGTFFWWLHIYISYYAYLASVRFDHSVFCGSVRTAEIYIYIYI